MPLVFPSSEPEDERTPESKAHHPLREAFYDVLRSAAGPEHTTATDVFVYFDKTDPHRRLARDPRGKDLVLTMAEERAVAEDKLREESAARSSAEDKLREMERELAELRERRGKE